MAKALYREYRPKTFDEVLGQDRVTDVLRNQVKTGKISHAYIFSGERGTGKTSCAKIFAKAINCKNPINGSPCLECENCKAIEDETTIDVVEMDAASNRRIDDIRNLKDNVIYPPNKLKYKVYIIDEAHMITREAFNALLKIMEEPPSHLIFILATTEIDKVPKTILSRVQKFEFSKISDRQIKEQIDKVLSDRNISIENEAIELIIKKANGAMRDALSILDQVVSFGTDSYSLAEVENILGVVDFYEVDKLTQSIITKDSKKSLESLFNLRNNNKPNKDILDALISYFNDIMIFKLTNDDSYFDNEDYIDFIKKRASEISDLEISDYLDILIEYSNKMKLTENTDVLTEVCLLRLINLKNINNIESRIEYLEKNSGENVVDLVNSILDKKLVNISSISNQNFKAEDSYYHSKEINSQKDLTKVQDKDVTLKESSKENKKEKENTSQNSEASLNANQEEEIKSMLIKTAGGVLNGLFAEEGFNYRIINKDFIIYVKDEFYKIFIETKLGNIENNLRSILRANYNLYVDSYDNIDNNIDKDETIKEAEENKNPKVDETDKLREIFGDELIIE
ncbi:MULTISPECIES: DNA polymerase III subunit gamma/tau [Anaerococcus]|uniref:DNA-directed DNA polymerase n=1 Tax=Anaerococcus nagyae TaxID=1755241 RepID=A0A3E2TJW3_9FIRM|nr:MULTISPECIES: DNA polymerase III subunit gamma/tau [Anaerococcus]MDU2353349.1 DNA polymerase III subunit gamma/tau [Anaerococcus sp.]RGB76484.1 DNA polymerase III subunit gamma/tau [Anaerococcus nagyae]